jgi:hypothetical protein
VLDKDPAAEFVASPGRYQMHSAPIVVFTRRFGAGVQPLTGDMMLRQGIAACLPLKVRVHNNATFGCLRQGTEGASDHDTTDTSRPRQSSPGQPRPRQRCQHGAGDTAVGVSIAEAGKERSDAGQHRPFAQGTRSNCSHHLHTSDGRQQALQLRTSCRTSEQQIQKLGVELSLSSSPIAETTTKQPSMKHRKSPVIQPNKRIQAVKQK